MTVKCSYDLQPTPDFEREMADQILDPPDAHPREHNIEFGRDGKPFYVAGPYDDDAKIYRIIKALERTAGEGNFDYMVGLGDPGFMTE